MVPSCPSGIYCNDFTSDHNSTAAHPHEWNVRLFRAQNPQGVPMKTPSTPCSTEILDEEAYSDDDEVGQDDPWIQVSIATQTPIPHSLHLLRIATTGNFGDKLHPKMSREIEERGGRHVQSVDRETSLLVSPHPFARSKKAYAARKLGIPIMDVTTFLQYPPEKSQYW